MLIYDKTESKLEDIIYAYCANKMSSNISRGVWIYIISKLTNQSYNIYLDDWDIEEYTIDDFVGIPKDYLNDIPIGEYEYKMVDYKGNYIGNGMLLIGPYTKDSNTTKKHTEIKYTTLNI